MVVLGSAVALLGLAITGTFALERHRLAQFNRTYDTPLRISRGDPVLADAHRLMDRLKPFNGPDSLRFAAMPSFGGRWFAVALRKDGDEARGGVVIENRPSGQVEVRTFRVSRQEFDLMMAKWDSLTDGYSGEGRSLADGTPLAFERRRGNRFTSGVGNSPCHYDVLGDLSAQFLARYVQELSDLREPGLPRYLASNYC